MVTFCILKQKDVYVEPIERPYQQGWYQSITLYELRALLMASEVVVCRVAV